MPWGARSSKEWQFWMMTRFWATFIKKEIDLDRPVAIGVTILERSKALMYSFLYEGKMIF